MKIFPLLSLWSQIQMLWQSPLVCGLSDREANARAGHGWYFRADLCRRPGSQAWCYHPSTKHRVSAECLQDICWEGCSQFWNTTYSSKYYFLRMEGTVPLSPPEQSWDCGCVALLKIRLYLNGKRQRDVRQEWSGMHNAICMKRDWISQT